MQVCQRQNRRWGAVAASPRWPFPSLRWRWAATQGEPMWMLPSFPGLLVGHRILVFSDISARPAPVLPCSSFLWAGWERRRDAGRGLFTGTPLVVLSGAVFVLVIVLFFMLYQKLYAPAVSAEVMEQQRLAEYARRFGLSAREQDILSFIVKGMSNAEISGALYITESTVKFHAGNIFKKTGQSSRLELIADYKLGHRAVR